MAAAYFISKYNSLKKELERNKRKLKRVNDKIYEKKLERDEYLEHKKYSNVFSGYENEESKITAKQLKKFDSDIRMLNVVKERVEYNIKSIGEEMAILNETIACQLDIEGYTK